MQWSKSYLYLVLLFMMLISACSSSTGEEGTASLEGEGERRETVQKPAALEAIETGFPVVVEHNGMQITIERKPQRIVAISLDTTDAVLELTDASNVVAAAESVGNPHLSFRSEEGAGIAHKLRFSDSQDPEKILSYDPDLILLTKQHEGEMDAENMLIQAGIPLISFQPWNTMEDIGENVRLIGKVIGEEEKARERVEAMFANIQEVQEAVKDIEEPRSVLVISPVGTNTGPFLLGTQSLATELLRLSGAIPAAELMGLHQTTPASIEQVIKADPDFILLTDWDGEGEKVFQELMETPGWNTLQAVQGNRVKWMDAKYVVTPNVHMAESIEEIASWLYPEALERGETR